jgi:tetratricopeptide (TPR) repeat protein
VARELDLRQRGDTAVRLPQHRTRSIPAYELFLRGNDPTLIRNDTTVLAGLEYFRRAVELDSNYAAAWAGLARLSLRIRGTGVGPLTREQYLAQAQQAARRALALDDALADAHASLGLTNVIEWDLTGAESHLRQALALDPAAARYHEWMVRFYVVSGRPTEAIAEARRALEREPLSPSANAEMARALLAGNRCDEALSYLEKVQGVNPPLLRAPNLRAQCLARKRMWQEALTQLQPQVEQGHRMTRGLYGYLLAGAGRREEAHRLLDSLKAVTTPADPRSTGEGLEIALVYAGLGDVDQMATWLDRGIEDGSFGPFVEQAPTVVLILDSLRHDRRVAGLRRRMGLESR